MVNMERACFRILRAALACVLAVGLVPAFASPAFADGGNAESGQPTARDGVVAKIGDQSYTSLQAAIGAADSQSVIVLVDDIDYGTIDAASDGVTPVTVPEGKQVTIDLAGYAVKASLLTNGSNYSSIQVIANKGTLTVKDSVGGGAIENVLESSNACTRTVKNFEGATLNLEGGTISSASAVGLLNLGTCSISGDKTGVQSLKEGYSGGWDNACAAIENRDDGKLTIHAGTFKSASEAALFCDSASALIEVYGGSFTGSEAYGAFNGSTADSSIVIYGGTWSSDPTDNLGLGAVVTSNGSSYTVASGGFSPVSVSGDITGAIKSLSDSNPGYLVVSGAATVSADVVLPKTSKIEVSAESSLTIGENVVFDRKGALVNNGTIQVDGFLSNPLGIEGNGEIAGAPDYSDGVYEVADAMDLQWLAYLVEKDPSASQGGRSSSGWNVVVENDIAMPNVAFQPIASGDNIFVGTVDGLGNEISNLRIESATSPAGLFYSLQNSTVKNLTLDVNVSTNSGYVGGLVAYSVEDNTFSNITVKGFVSANGASYGVGGIAASVMGSTDFVGCRNEAAIGGTEAYNVGGMFGTAEDATGAVGIYNCENAGNITAKGSMGYVFGWGHLAEGSSLSIIGFDSKGKVNGGEGSISSAPGSGFTYDTGNAGAEYAATKGENGDWTAIEASKAHVYVDGVAFTDFASAINSVSDGSFVEVESAVTVTSPVEINKNIRLTGMSKITVANGGSLSISSGTYDANPSAYVGEDAVVESREDGTYSVAQLTAETAVAKVGDKYFASLAKAIMAMTEGQTVMLLKDSTVLTEKDPEYNLPANSTLDLGGHELTVPFMSAIFQGENATIRNGSISSTADYALWIGNGDKQTSIVVQDVSVVGGINVFVAQATLENVSVDASGKTYYAVWGDEAADITIKSGTYIGGKSGSSVLAFGGVDADGTQDGGDDAARIAIEGGTFSGSIGVFNAFNPEVDYLTVSGGTFSSDPSDFVAAGYAVTANADDAYTVYRPYVPAPQPTPQPDTEVTENPDGSTTTTVTEPDGTVTETTEGAADGSTTVVVTEPTGESTTTVTSADGTVGTVDKDAEGAVVSVSAEVSEEAAQAAAESGEPVVLPVEPVAPAASAEDAPEVVVSVPESEAVAVALPVTAEGEPASPGAVLVKVGADGSEEVVPKTAVDGASLVASMEGEGTFKVVDRSTDFPDVSDADWYAVEGVADFVSARGLISGVPTEDGLEFQGEAPMDRAMFATVLYRLESSPEAGVPEFGDVAEGQWYATPVAWAAESGIVSGYGDTGMFGPSDRVTREQMAVMLYRYAQWLGLPTDARADLSGFADAGEVSDWAEDAVSWAVAEGLIQGRGGVLLAPSGDATRAEASAVLMRFVNGVLY